MAPAIQQVLTAGIERRGTSFSSYLDADGTPGENQDFLRVYGRFDEPCYRCGSPIRRLLIGQRTSHYCPVCQPSGSQQLLKAGLGAEGADHSQAEGLGLPELGGNALEALG